MVRVKQFIQKNRFMLLIAICTIFILILPNLHENIVIGDDYLYHLGRIQSMADSIRNGVYLVKVNGTLANYFGYASRNVLS